MASVDYAVSASARPSSREMVAVNAGPEKQNLIELQGIFWFVPRLTSVTSTPPFDESDNPWSRCSRRSLIHNRVPNRGDDAFPGGGLDRRAGYSRGRKKGLAAFEKKDGG